MQKKNERMRERGLSYFSLFFPPCEVSASRKNYSLSSRSPYVRVSRTVLNSGFHAVDPASMYWFQYLSLELGFWVPIVMRILDSIRKFFTGFWNQDSLTWRKTAVLSCTKNIPSPDEFTPNVIQTRTTTVGLT